MQLAFLAISLFSLVASPLFAQESVQMVFEQDIAPEFTAHISLVGDSATRSAAQASITKAAKQARAALDQIDTKAAGGTSATSEEANCINGHLADVMADDLEHSGYKDVFLELNGVYVAKGRDFNGPWRVPVVEKSAGSAHHAFFYKAQNVAAATIDKSESAPAANDLKSVTVFSEDGACKAERLASAAYAAGLSSAKKILKDSSVARYVLIDQNGNFIQTPQ